MFLYFFALSTISATTEATINPIIRLPKITIIILVGCVSTIIEECAKDIEE